MSWTLGEVIYSRDTFQAERQRMDYVLSTEHEGKSQGDTERMSQRKNQRSCIRYSPGEGKSRPGGVKALTALSPPPLRQLRTENFCHEVIINKNPHSQPTQAGTTTCLFSLSLSLSQLFSSLVWIKIPIQKRRTVSALLKNYRKFSSCMSKFGRRSELRA